jgi:GNAT superfamily N-acetyltransferase
VLAGAHGDDDAGAAPRPDDHVPCARRAVHEVPGAQRPLLALDDEHRLARHDEEGLLIGLPVVHGHRLAGPEHERVDAELPEPTLALEVVDGDADRAAPLGVTPLGVPQVEDVPALAGRDEPVLRPLRNRLGNHGHNLYHAAVRDVQTGELLTAYDAELRAHVPPRLPTGVSVERDGPLLRFLGFGGGGAVVYRDLGGLAGAELDELIARQVDVFAERGEPFEWKLHGHDRPADLPERLRAAGFVSEEQETVVIAPVGGVAGEPRLPHGVSLREVTERADLDRIAALEETIWRDDRGWLAESLEAERDADPEAIAIVVAEAGADVVCAGWVRFAEGTDFATLWGGGTLPEWRGRGIYRATVAYRASLAAGRGYRLLQVDASDDSRPILERLGFRAVTTTTPYVWSPPAGRG